MNNTLFNILYLISNILQGKIPEKEKIMEMDLNSLFQYAKKNSLTSIAAYALESAGINDSDFQKEKNLAIRNIMVLDAERKRICRFLEDNKIWYMLLKGVHLKEYYPKIGMRQMCDNDILIDPDFIKTVDKWMLECGYSKHYDSKHDFSYLKEPCYNFEIHYALAADYHGHGWSEYYSNIKEKLIKKSDSSYEYKFTNEDFYIFLTLHEYKHYSNSGTGLRSLVDKYVYLSKFSDTMNWEYIREECTKLEIAEFEEKSRMLAIKVFSAAEFPELTIEEQKMLNYYLDSGTYGNLFNKAVNEVEKVKAETGSSSKLRYLIRRVFPPMEVYKDLYPFFYKHKILLPIGWAYRLFRGIFCKTNMIKSEMKVIRNMKKGL